MSDALEEIPLGSVWTPRPRAKDRRKPLKVARAGRGRLNANCIVANYVQADGSVGTSTLTLTPNYLRANYRVTPPSVEGE